MNVIKTIAKKSRFLQVLHRQYRFSRSHPSWKPLVYKDKEYWKSMLAEAKKGPKILIATSIGCQPLVTTLDSLLAVSLTLRGADVHVLLCDSALPACFECGVGFYKDPKNFVKYGPGRDLCRGCFSSAAEMYGSLSLTMHRYSRLLTSKDRDEAVHISSTIPLSGIGTFTFDGMAVGEHALAGALRFFARASLDSEPYGEGVVRRYLQAALLTAFAYKRLLSEINFECSVCIHGIYVPHGIIGEVCRKNKVRVVNWNTGYKNKCFVFSHGDTYHHTMMNEPVGKWENLVWDDTSETLLMDYLRSRWEGKKDWIWFHEKPRFDLSEIAREAKIDYSKPRIGLLTSVMWDAQLHYPSNAFTSQLAWIFETIGYFINRPGLQLIIRVHPAEVRGALPSRQRITEEIKNRYPGLPSNIIVIPPESNISTYPLMLSCDSVIIYNTKTGIELSAMGIPVIVAGEAWIKNKGFALDINDRNVYFELLDRLPIGKRMSGENITRAKKYAFHFFFRRKIPLEFIESTKAFPPFRIDISGIRDLRPGKSPGLDIICDGILNEKDFIYPAENYERRVPKGRMQLSRA